jgi:putative ABC transport system permease protein
MGRAKEVGVRKVIGAHKHQLIFQFLTESVLVNLLSLLIALAIVALVLPYFNRISGLSLDFSYLYQGWFIGLLSSIWIISALLSGFYPAWVLSSFKPIVVLKGKLKSATAGMSLRKGLVITQFMASIALIAGTVIIYRQLNYMMSKNLGVNINQVLVMDRPGIALKNEENYKAYDHAIDVFRDELRKSSDIKGVSTSLTIPGHQRAFKVTIKPYGGIPKDSVFLRVNSMDYDFLNVYKMNMVAGRGFSKEFPADPDTSVILTESAVPFLGYKHPQDAIGKTIVITEFNNAKLIIVGVVNDYHQVSLKKPIEPTIFLCSPYDGEYYSIRINTDHLPETLDHVHKSWSKAFPGNPFEYSFLDEYFNQQYKNERRFGELFTTFAILAIIISCLGLFGLSAFTASQRIREIGIRKVLGASVTNLTAMLSRDFLKLVLISILIATPLAWFTMDTWLRNFAYRIDISWWVFVLAGLAALLIALLTVSFQAIKAAVANPVKSLRTE